MSVIKDHPINDKVFEYFMDEHNLETDVILVWHSIKGYILSVMFTVDSKDFFANYYGCDHIPTIKKMEKWLNKTGEEINGS
jgi:hypothetical protein